MPRTKKITPTDEVEVIAQTRELVTAESLPEQSPVVKQQADIDGFLSQRAAFITKVNAIMVEGKDYHVIQGKKSLAKGGSEKIASIFHWTAKFDKDTEALEMLGEIKGLVAFKCTLQNNGEFVGEGRGASMLSKNAGDPNKTLKMSQKSAFIDAILRSSGLSDFFSQDLEDMNLADIGGHQTVSNSYPPTDKQIDMIKSLLEQKRVDEAWLIDQGLPPIEKMSGGKGGTASEAIGILLKYIPTESVTIQGQGMDFSPKVIERLSGPAEMAIADLEACQTQLDYEDIYGAIKTAKANNKFSEWDWGAIIKIAKITVDRLTNK